MAMVQQGHEITNNLPILPMRIMHYGEVTTNGLMDADSLIHQAFSVNSRRPI